MHNTPASQSGQREYYELIVTRKTKYMGPSTAGVLRLLVKPVYVCMQIVLLLDESYNTELFIVKYVYVVVA